MAKNKGKKFDAHEKHFDKMKIRLNQEINYVTKIYHETKEENIYLRIENDRLKKENLDIRTKYEKLLDYNDLSDKEMREAVKRDESVNKIAVMMDMANDFI